LTRTASALGESKRDKVYDIIQWSIKDEKIRHDIADYKHDRINISIS